MTIKERERKKRYRGRESVNMFVSEKRKERKRGSEGVEEKERE